MEEILLESMFDLPSMDGVDEAIVNREVVEGRAQPLYAYADKKEDSSAAPEMAS
jgi:ATP-dependent Clp protease ATP-binding subunit ClpX